MDVIKEEMVTKVILEIRKDAQIGGILHTDKWADVAYRIVELFTTPDVSVALLERAASLVGNPGTNISGSTDIACDEWQKDYERWRNER